MDKARQLLFVVMGMAAALQCLAADINFSSSSDFTQINLRLKRGDSSVPQSLTLEITLGLNAQRRMARISREEMNKPLRLFINGLLVSTPTVRSVLDSPGIQIHVSREVALALIPTLLEPLTPR